MKATAGHKGDLTSPLMAPVSALAPDFRPGDVRGVYSPPRSPALAPWSSVSSNTVEQTWFIDEPSRQLTGSTTASESDFSLPSAFCSPDLMRAKRLEALRERRGWKYFLKHQMQVPMALVAGMIIGSIVTILTFMLFSRPGLAPATAPASAAPYEAVLPPTEVPWAYFASPALNNSCLIPELAIPAGPQTFDACSFVIKSTDEVWNLRGNVDAAIDKYFHEEYFDAGSWGRRIVGKQALREAILSEMRAFPDIRIHITDCLCQGNDNDGYKCAMPDVLTGTNLGPSAYGPPTGRYARWTGLVQSFVKFDQTSKQWQYFAEWGVHDEWALIQQLGLDFARVPHPYRNSEPLHDCSPLLRMGPSPTMDADDYAEQQAAARAAALAKERGIGSLA
mmetsp:Transcript_28527/g.77271  ORF Transcript_28527/g.77271 Transcript_28527/m.77271 type:complete len:392 (-) Transcript_28527:130-1305(-)